MRREFFASYARFSLVGLSNGVVDYGALNLLMLLFPTRHPVLLASYNVVALILANANSYVWNSRWTFRGRSDRSPRELLLFSSQAALNILVAGGVIWGVSSLLFADTNLPSLVVGDAAKVTSSVVATTLSFLVLRYVVFRERPRGERMPDLPEATTPPCRSSR
ncbi:GtrA family protein [Rubrobacter naiadicus]|uniref:GtrA family protein n=1 Tax=Rubrobacter naiadicus TaxID=1392641 RepID=UPI00235EADCF|nr:GtrA family protein [Rubrobacter naiadicus]